MSSVRDEFLKNCVNHNVPLGHFTKKWDSRNLNNILMEEYGSHILDPNVIAERLNSACDKLKSIVAGKNKVLFVCTKKIGKSYIKKTATDVGMPYVTEKWFGCILTNFIVLKKMIKRVESMNSLKTSPSFQLRSKKEQRILLSSIHKNNVVLDGINDRFFRLPGALIVVDIKKENIAVNEAKKMGIPVFGLVDTNANPDLVSDPIPCNDDSLKSIIFVIEHLKNAINEGLSETTNSSNSEFSEVDNANSDEDNYAEEKEE